MDAPEAMLESEVTHWLTRSEETLAAHHTIHTPNLALLGLLSFVIALAVNQEATAQRKIRVATREVPPFAMRHDDGRWYGISIDLVEQLRNELDDDGVELEFVNLSLRGMLSAVANHEVDLAAAALTVNYEREQSIDFSHPYYSGGLGIAVRIDEDSQGLWRLVRAILPTFMRVVAGLFVTMLAVGLVVYLCERRANRDQFGGSAIRGILSGFWWSAVTLTTVGYGDKVPKSAAGRLIGMAWMFSGLFIIASFTAAITSALTLTELRSHISDPSDLSRVRVATVRDSTSARYLRIRRIIARGHSNVVQALESLAAGECDAVVYDAPLLRYQVQEQFRATLYVLPTEFERQDYAFALPPESELREPVNQALLRIKGSPDWESRLAEFLGDRPN